jgi:archaemetzincin
MKPEISMNVRDLSVSWRAVLAALALAWLALPSSPSRANSFGPPIRVRLSLELIILGSFPAQAILDIESALRYQLGVQVVASKRRELPAEAYYAPRKRYRAERLLASLEQSKRSGIAQLGLTEVDVSTTKGKHEDWGIFGMASIGGESAVISTSRLRRGHPTAALYRFRIITTAVHEVGHMLGLDHCTEPRCVMNDAEGSIRTVDESSGAFGPSCRARLDAIAPLNRAPVPAQ